MKYNSLKYTLVFLSLISITLWGCLKDESFDDHEIQSVAGSGNQNVVSMALTATNTTNHLQIAFDKSDADTTFDAIPVTLAGQPATEDIQVKLVINPALLGDYNAENGTLHEEAPTSVYSVTNATGDSATGYIVTIPKGSNTGYLQLKIKPNDFLGKDYALGVQISSISPAGYLIASNLSAGILALSTKNLWDGKYTLVQKQVGWAAYGIADGETNTWPSDVSIITASAVADDINTPEGGNLQPAFTPGGGVTVFGATAPRFTFDPVTNAVVSVENTIPDDGRGRTLQLNPAVTDSRYDPATKTIYVAYIMKQNGRPDQYIYDTLTYVGPR
ncbi:DUF1735 domain-containing protein [Ilyomonas limi]|uniref:DUF1735 domain-containing protein n=1 Tax=Ilyomonas limi TaxID=2575867 RepID=A0A4U3LAZ6_9BACT|nr:DUF1735 domain-containing protein [Ilyomonas limi]TKK70977.1 DUF1735 domain-containing protein [Ilyomonas limi]